MWKILIGGVLGFGMAKLLQGKSNSKDSIGKIKDVEKKVTNGNDALTWKEEVVNSIDKEGVDYAFDGYSEWDEPKFKNAKFQKARKEYVKAKKSLENYIPKIKNEKARNYTEGVIDKEGFDYAFTGYSDFKQYYDSDVKKSLPFKDLILQSKIAQYEKKRTALLESVGLNNKDY